MQTSGWQQQHGSVQRHSSVQRHGSVQRYDGSMLQMCVQQVSQSRPQSCRPTSRRPPPLALAMSSVADLQELQTLQVVRPTSPATWPPSPATAAGALAMHQAAAWPSSPGAAPGFATWPNSPAAGVRPQLFTQIQHLQQQFRELQQSPPPTPHGAPVIAQQRSPLAAAAPSAVLGQSILAEPMAEGDTAKAPWAASRWPGELLVSGRPPA
eukprot:CAMPEP_0180753082 /NCGR_PEP_ID=MMETSP1038_2-20121128/32486_1 /TAXON_ID=632150 /ORGANISM="Azadinium spinosum, Strain 3D9" /LENGTH=209 /DNA_ID=CAMNT_0022786931 /DNA_START=55 /DNA_END=680 /DNA_ORIENTATION=+